MILTISNISIGYGNKAILSGLDKSFESGQAVCIAGRNGKGKSTLLRTIAALQPPLSGSITIDDTEIATLPKKQLSRIIGIVLTPSTRNNDATADSLTVTEVVAMGRMPYTGFFGSLTDNDKAIVEKSIATIDITALASRKVGSLSDGERQKVMIAKTLAQQTPVILLDEPTAFLDYESRLELYSLLQQLAHEQQKLILFSSHDLDMATKYVDNIWKI